MMPVVNAFHFVENMRRRIDEDSSIQTNKTSPTSNTNKTLKTILDESPKYWNTIREIEALTEGKIRIEYSKALHADFVYLQGGKKNYQNWQIGFIEAGSLTLYDKPQAEFDELRKRKNNL